MMGKLLYFMLVGLFIILEMVSGCSCDESTSLAPIPPDIKILNANKTEEVSQITFGKVAKLYRKDITIYIQNIVDNSKDLEVFSIDFIDDKGNTAPSGLFITDRTTLRVSYTKAEPVIVSFTPTDLIVYNYFMVIKNNSFKAERREFRIPVLGEGMLPKMSLSEDELDFGNVWVGYTITKDFMISNWNGVGAGPLSIYKFEFSNDKDSFSITQPDIRNLPVVVGVGESLTVTVSFMPLEIRDYASILTLYTDDPDNRTVKINLKGKGIEVPKNEPPIARIFAKVNDEWVECKDEPLKLPVPGEVELSAKFSEDPNNDPIVKFYWNIAKDENDKDMAPEGSDFCFDCARGRNTHFKESRKDLTRFFGDIVGDYTIKLIVEDAAALKSSPAFCEIQGYAAQALHIELRWNTPRTDVDLHLINLSAISYSPLNSDGMFSCPCDCYTGNRNPDWGKQIPYKNLCVSDDGGTVDDIEELPLEDSTSTISCCRNPNGNSCDPECIPTYGADTICLSYNDAGESMLTRDPICYKGGDKCVLTCEPDESSPFYKEAVEDNPTLDIDDVEGFGPENINIINPSPGNYRITVHYFNDQGIGPSDVWVKVYIKGINKPEWVFGPFTLKKSKQAWDVAIIQWPDSSPDPTSVKVIPLQPWTLRDVSKCIGCTCELR